MVANLLSMIYVFISLLVFFFCLLSFKDVVLYSLIVQFTIALHCDVRRVLYFAVLVLH